MNCQYCGKKIGILENWRYGRFCSKEHQTEFQEESSRLATSVLVSEHESGPSLNRADEILAIAGQPRAGGPAESLPPPDPPIMGTVEQSQPSAVRCAPPAPPPTPPPASERDQKLLRLLAAADRVPPVLEKDSRRRLVIGDAPFRFGTVMARGTRRVLIPPSGAVQRRPKLRLIETLLPLRYDETGGPLPEFEPAWQDGAVWGADEQSSLSMDFGPYIQEYTLEQPWQDWDWDALLEEAKYFQELAEQREKQRGELRSQKAQAKAPESAPAPRPQNPSYPAMPGQTWPGRAPSRHPASAPVPAFTGLTNQTGPMTPRPAPQFSAPHAAGPGGILVSSMPSYPGTTGLRPVPAGVPPAMGQPRKPGLNMPLHGVQRSPAQSDGGHMEWVELAPPPFMALCRIDDPAPVRGNRRPAIPPSPPQRSTQPAFFPHHAIEQRAASGLTLGELGFDPEAILPPVSPKSFAMEIPASPRPAGSSLCLPHRPSSVTKLALPQPARSGIVLDLRPIPAIERPHLRSRISG